MNQRERILAISVGALVALVGAWWLVSSVTGAFESRQTQLAAIRKEVEEKEAEVRRGTRAKAQIQQWQKRSLSSDPNRAQSDYRVWLDGLVTKAGLVARPEGGSAVGELYYQHAFEVNGETEMRKLIQFLHEFYSAGYLHRVSSLNLGSQPDKKELAVNLNIHVLSLNSAPKESPDKTPPADPPLAKDVAAYSAAILGRNFFFPANNPPRIASPGPQRRHPNRTLSFTVKASDPDKSDRLTYSLVSPTLDGARIDPKSGEVRWTPKELASDLSLTVRVTDDGNPPRSDEEKIRISVVEPPPPQEDNRFAKDDPARTAKVTALVGPPDDLQVWVIVQRGMGDQPRVLHLNAGHKISVGSFTGVVKEVRPREAVFELTDGRTVTVRSGQPLVGAGPSSGGL